MANVLESVSASLSLIRREDLTKSLESAIREQKILGDLQQGFRITIKYDVEATISDVEVVTRFGDDIFFVKASRRDSYRNVYDDVRFELEVRRRKKLPPGPGSATLERWALVRETLDMDEDVFRVQHNKGGCLEEEEFWRRYNASEVDPAATKKYFEFRKEETLARYKPDYRERIEFEESLT